LGSDSYWHLGLQRYWSMHSCKIVKSEVSTTKKDQYSLRKDVDQELTGRSQGQQEQLSSQCRTLLMESVDGDECFEEKSCFIRQKRKLLPSPLAHWLAPAA